MTTVYLAPGPFGAGGQFFGLGGLPLNLGTITTYAAGTTTPLATYTTSAGSVQNANPIVLGTDGRPPNEIWVTSDFYRFDLKDSLGNLIKTYDNLGGAYVDAASLASTALGLGAALVGFIQAGIGAIARTVLAKLRDTISITDFMTSAQVTDYTTRAQTLDLSVAIQAAIDAVSTAGGGELWCPIGTAKCNVINKSGVYLNGAGFGYLASGSAFTTTFIAAATGAVIDTPGTAVANLGVSCINLKGLGAGTAAKGVRIRSATRASVDRCNFDNFADEAIVTDSACLIPFITRNMATNCLLNRTRAGKTGVIDIDGSDFILKDNEATASLSALSDANAYLCAFVIRGDNGTSSHNIGEISDVGIHVATGASLNAFSEDRADLCFGNGIEVFGSGSTYGLCKSINNGQETTNTYSNWRFDSTSANNQTTGCFSLSNIAKVVKYGFEDLVNSAANKNQHSNNFSTGAGTANYKCDTANASAHSFPSGGSRILAANSTTPSVEAYGNFITANSNPTTYTDFTLGVSGHLIRVFCNDSNTTIQHNGATISTLNAGNVKLRSGVSYWFTRDGTLWREIVPFPLGTSADNGDAAKSIQTRVDFETQIWNTPLTVNRAVTLSTTGVYDGAKFHIKRKAAATGGATLDVGTGPLKSLAVGQWCDVIYNGNTAAWELDAFGSL